VGKGFLPIEARFERFLNAEPIAAGVYPLNPELGARSAARIFLVELDVRVRRRVPFAIESNLGGKSHPTLFRAARASVHDLINHLLFLEDADLAAARGKERVSKGGHTFPEEEADHRFERRL
jgi:predicted ABC-type ATPase